MDNNVLIGIALALQLVCCLALLASSAATEHPRHDTADSPWFYALQVFVLAIGGFVVHKASKASKSVENDTDGDGPTFSMQRFDSHPPAVSEEFRIQSLATGMSNIASGVSIATSAGGMVQSSSLGSPEPAEEHKGMFIAVCVFFAASIGLGLVGSFFFVAHASELNVTNTRCDLAIDSPESCSDNRERLRATLARLGVYTAFALLALHPLASWLVAHKHYVVIPPPTAPSLTDDQLSRADFPSRASMSATSAVIRHPSGAVTSRPPVPRGIVASGSPAIAVTPGSPEMMQTR
ncbi:uncharacterized protein AMSG_00280 [Thecamonas trahens ATCC 50062]|uniref:Transmembrane protein n=1 Tax=Thecamonas trahens ATCC 50062 TaxID=461836 RepID=A0A0L0D1S6_THETB|nr:hypothetical protein AMSG_00280 [Thecamonas trahens ATCC 50062]KNC46161.1 hypothetical protein AMSG_00280 [Thecamonas trahens ATCC 50062]|eukprot:XP_013763137.1 hypothetical protein AMSG_00280 [Thecamonas trahens ATCC 50062]